MHKAEDKTISSGVFYSKDFLNETYHYKIFNHENRDHILEAKELIKKWIKIDDLNLIISVTGGAQNFSLPSRIKTSFKEGIAKIALSTNALIITGGTSTGVMKLVGDAIAINDEVLKKRNKIKCLGIACFQRIKFNEILENNIQSSKSTSIWKRKVIQK